MVHLGLGDIGREKRFFRMAPLLSGGYNAQGINMYDAKDIPEIIERLKKAESTWEQ